ncbi:hypothetical protein [Leptospira ainazelensis]|uniref:hypothetical protein n=1 Tax=Leptospira ainazelensis TaxID=2810034 RepID=UPI001963C486|nr:hypothetical protein [Leptospira ainazelensis]
MNLNNILFIVFILISLPLFSEVPDPPNEQRGKKDLYNYWHENYKKGKIEKCEVSGQPKKWIPLVIEIHNTEEQETN